MSALVSSPCFHPKHTHGIHMAVEVLLVGGWPVDEVGWWTIEEVVVVSGWLVDEVVVVGGWLVGEVVQVSG